MATRGWQFWVDRGGTFTDIVAQAPDRTLRARKLLSENPECYQDAAVAGIAEILADAAGPRHIDAIKMGTTVATNALLERKGEPTVLVITSGFADALRIGYQNRPDIFALQIRLPQLLYSAVIEADERVDANGEVLQRLDAEKLRRDLAKARAAGFRSAAICFLHAYRFAAHETTAGQLAREAGFEQISLSHEVSPLMKLISRGDTTVVDAYLSPVLLRYIERLRRGLQRAKLNPERLLFMQSNGGLVDQSQFRGKDSILSGPAGGVVGMVEAARREAGDRLIGFDMGGTSTDVSLFDGDFDYVNDTEIAGVRMRSPMIRIHTIAAGGGSLLTFESGRFQVGPESAGADPGPASYRRGGPLAITDANLALGRIRPEFFPNVFGPAGNEALDREAVEHAFSEIATRVERETGRAMSQEEVAEGFVRIAVDNMANAIKTVSIQRGFDPAEFSLCCFGGAGGQHACMVADQLGIRRVIIDPLAGVLSAFGMGVAPLRTYRQQSIETALDEATVERLVGVIGGLEAKCGKALMAQGVAPQDASFRAILHIRVTGADTALAVRWDELSQMRAAFCRAHQERFGFAVESARLTVESLRVEGLGAAAPHQLTEASLAPSAPKIRPASARLWSSGSWQDAQLHHWSALNTGDQIAGPALVLEENSTTVLEPGWKLQVNSRRQLVLTRTASEPRRESVTAAADPVLLEVFNNHFMNVAEQMGAVLEKTAHSVNIKERLDFSCAVFDPDGHLIANAPHIPVHLGSMGDSVRAVLTDNRADMLPGDSFMLNAPYNGGTHLPDITVVTPVFDADGRGVLFVVACRAHHADIGGQTPGSMPPFSRSIDEEGVLLDNFLLVRKKHFHETELRRQLNNSRFPARNPEQNIADLKAQLAANERGVQELRNMAAHFGLATVQAYMRHVQDNAEEAVRLVIDRLEDGDFSYEMDGGEVICIRVRIDRGRREALIDFGGTSEQIAGNLNAPFAVARAAVLYVFRTLVQRDIPLNAGCLKPLKLEIPEGCLLHPCYPAAVVAGNVETSQCIADALYGAMGVMAAAQGTMNNLTFGNERFQYYETICGGTGAGAGFPGTDAVHSHMTNSRLTDPEVLEARFPVLLRQFVIRRGSGGAGRQPGGNGVIRMIEFRESMSAAIISNHRRIPPFGLAGGKPGRPGKNYIVRENGEREALTATDEIEVHRGDVLVVETPGGGGFGVPARAIDGGRNASQL
jgi:5-oxoprolinase (ATP-hydrolysing)